MQKKGGILRGIWCGKKRKIFAFHKSVEEKDKIVLLPLVEM